MGTAEAVAVGFVADGFATDEFMAEGFEEVLRRAKLPEGLLGTRGIAIRTRGVHQVNIVGTDGQR